jgi:hypothetical protein
LALALVLGSAAALGGLAAMGQYRQTKWQEGTLQGGWQEVLSSLIE